MEGKWATFPGNLSCQNKENVLVSLCSQIVHLKLVNYPLFFPRGMLFYSRTKKANDITSLFSLSFLSSYNRKDRTLGRPVLSCVWCSLPASMGSTQIVHVSFANYPPFPPRNVLLYRCSKKQTTLPLFSLFSLFFIFLSKVKRKRPDAIASGLFRWSRLPSDLLPKTSPAQRRAGQKRRRSN